MMRRSCAFNSSMVSSVITLHPSPFTLHSPHAPLASQEHRIEGKRSQGQPLADLEGERIEDELYLVDTRSQIDPAQDMIDRIYFRRLPIHLRIPPAIVFFADDQQAVIDRLGFNYNQVRLID